MITRMYLWGEDDDWAVGVSTDNGGDQTYGPFQTEQEALQSLRSVVENDFDETFDPAKIIRQPHPSCDRGAG